MAPPSRPPRDGAALKARRGLLNSLLSLLGLGDKDRGRGRGGEDDDRGRGQNDNDQGRGSDDDGRGPGKDSDRDTPPTTTQRQPAPTPTPEPKPTPQTPPAQEPKPNNLNQSPPADQKSPPTTTSPGRANPTPGPANPTPAIPNPGASSPVTGNEQGNGSNGDNSSTVKSQELDGQNQSQSPQGQDQTGPQQSNSNTGPQQSSSDTGPNPSDPDTATSTSPASAATTSSPGMNGDAFSSTDWSEVSPGSYGKSSSSGVEGSDQGSSTNPGAIAGGIIAGILILLALLVLLLYKYRRTRRVQSFLIKYTPLKISAYTAAEKKRSSMGAGLLFTDGSYGDALIDEKTTTTTPASGYGTITPSTSSPGATAAAAIITPPSRSALPRERPDAPPALQPLSPSSTGGGSTTQGHDQTHRITIRPHPGAPPATASPPPLLDLHTPRSPPPIIPSPNRRASQDSIDSAVTTSTTVSSIASSRTFSPSLISWPMPPSSSAASFWNRSSTAGSSRGSLALAELQGRYVPLTPTRVGSALGRP
ncbi:hypothetical protein VTJ49DRAFT_4058 [Mycothermus thermophilus]|uniref:Uncharacterized protein n=1 Tax=Humicola insolens TaxID=85995 RepID=A0ABR3V6A5_HUMIN